MSLDHIPNNTHEMPQPVRARPGLKEALVRFMVETNKKVFVRFANDMESFEPYPGFRLGADVSAKDLVEVTHDTNGNLYVTDEEGGVMVMGTDQNVNAPDRTFYIPGGDGVLQEYHIKSWMQRSSKLQGMMDDYVQTPTDGFAQQDLVLPKHGFAKFEMEVYDPPYVFDRYLSEGQVKKDQNGQEIPGEWVDCRVAAMCPDGHTHFFLADSSALRHSTITE